MIDKKDKDLHIRAQAIEDPVSGFSFRFIVTGAESPYRILFKAPADAVWREFLFDKNGLFSGATTRVAAEDLTTRVLRLVK
jgi:hypothetical protein